MQRELTQKEKAVLEKFSAHKPELVPVIQTSMTSKDDIYSLKNAMVYKIPETDMYLVFGEICKSMSYKDMEKWLSEKMSKYETESPVDVEGHESSHGHSHGHGCSHGCSHHHGDHHHEGPVEEINEEKAGDKNVELLMSQGGIDYATAERMLKDTDGDVVAALVEVAKMNQK